MRKILVIGGNGFIGSAVCKAAVARGIQVTSISSSGKPYRTAKGHSPAWTSKVDWQKGDALNPSTFSQLFPQVDGVVCTLGLLLEDTSYKQSLRDGNVIKLLGSLWTGVVGGEQRGNPLKRGIPVGTTKMTYELMNRDSALRVCEVFISSDATPVDQNLGTNDHNHTRPFIYVSAEDIFRPFIPARYISTKREAEEGIERLISNDLRDRFRGVYIRPSLVYHAHHRPLTTPAATLLDLSATLHRKIPQGIPTPSSVLRTLGTPSLFSSKRFDTPAPSLSQEDSVKNPGLTELAHPLESIANALTVPPIHVDTVAAAICEALESRSNIRGVVDVKQMRKLVGWRDDSEVSRQPSVDPM
ncbi:mitochondrial protein [Crepidotus variabilis]|uniref:Mitochondrial protein n=1 Tax=Crepidotus variabilis TaxID=179855 RepID=A0A9P6EU65_9AGAR|nr:mitochondrial protein [Crepidotus variabilis]